MVRQAPQGAALTGLRRLTIDGRHWEVRRYRETPAGAPTLAFLHEGLGSVSTWRDFPLQLASACGCGAVAWSRLGYGGSDPAELPRPLDYMQREASEHVPLLLEALGIRRAVLYGHSDGATIALAFAGDPDARSRTSAELLGVVAEAPHVFVEESGLEAIRAAGERYATGDLRERLARHHGANVDIAFLGWRDAWLDPGFPQALELAPWLERIAVPALVLQGTSDPYGTVEQARRIRAAVPVAVEVHLFDGAGHSPHRERPADVIRAVAAFAAAVR